MVTVRAAVKMVELAPSATGEYSSNRQPQKSLNKILGGDLAAVHFEGKLWDSCGYRESSWFRR